MYPEILGVDSLKLCYLVGTIGLLISSMVTRNRYKLSKTRAIVFSLILVTAGLIEFKIMGIIQQTLIRIASNGEVEMGVSFRIIGVVFFQPIVIYVLSLLTGEKFRKIADFIAPGTYVCFIFGKLACVFEGCCHGIPYENGVQTLHYKDGLVFPVQIYEVISTVVVVLILYLLLSSKLKLRKGSLFPIGNILYCSVRFLWENYRYYDNQWESNYLLGMTFWQVCCVIAIIMSAIWLVVLYAIPKYAECSFEINENAPFCKIATKLNKTWNCFKHRNDKNIVHHKKKKK